MLNSCSAPESRSRCSKTSCVAILSERVRLSLYACALCWMTLVEDDAQRKDCRKGDEEDHHRPDRGEPPGETRWAVKNSWKMSLRVGDGHSCQLVPTLSFPRVSHKKPGLLEHRTLPFAFEHTKWSASGSVSERSKVWRSEAGSLAIRHTFASRLVQRGVALYTVKSLIGHSTITVTERYAHLNPQRLMKAMSVLETSVVESASLGHAGVLIVRHKMNGDSPVSG